MHPLEKTNAHICRNFITISLRRLMLKYQNMSVLDCSLACNKCDIAFYMRYINLHRIIIKYICLYIFIFSKVVSKDVKQTKYRRIGRIILI